MNPGVILIAVLAAAILLYAVVASGGKKRPRRTSSHHNSGYRKVSALAPAEVRNRWDSLMAISNSGASGLKSAINEADKLFDHVMMGQGVPGDTFGERLKSARPRFPNYSTYDAVWRAHKLRNTMAHELGFDLVPSQAREALADFERGLRELGAL